MDERLFNEEKAVEGPIYVEREEGRRRAYEAKVREIREMQAPEDEEIQRIREEWEQELREEESSSGEEMDDEDEEEIRIGKVIDRTKEYIEEEKQKSKKSATKKLPYIPNKQVFFGGLPSPT